VIGKPNLALVHCTAPFGPTPLQPALLLISTSRLCDGGADSVRVKPEDIPYFDVWFLSRSRSPRVLPAVGKVIVTYSHTFVSVLEAATRCRKVLTVACILSPSPLPLHRADNTIHPSGGGSARPSRGLLQRALIAGAGAACQATPAPADQAEAPAAVAAAAHITAAREVITVAAAAAAEAARSQLPPFPSRHHPARSRTPSQQV